MSESNKKSLILFAKVVCVFLLALVIIISNAAVWNAFALGCTAVDGFVLGVSIVNFLFEIGALVWVCIKKVFAKKE